MYVKIKHKLIIILPFDSSLQYFEISKNNRNMLIINCKGNLKRLPFTQLEREFRTIKRRLYEKITISFVRGLVPSPATLFQLKLPYDMQYKNKNFYTINSLLFHGKLVEITLARAISASYNRQLLLCKIKLSRKKKDNFD